MMVKNWHRKISMVAYITCFLMLPVFLSSRSTTAQEAKLDYGAKAFGEFEKATTEIHNLSLDGGHHAELKPGSQELVDFVESLDRSVKEHKSKVTGIFETLVDKNIELTKRVELLEKEISTLQNDINKCSKR